MRRAKLIQVLATLLALSMLAAACAPGGGANDTADSTPDGSDDDPPADDADADAGEDEDNVEGDSEAAETSSLRMTVWTGNDAHLDLFNEIADSFIADHPTVEEVNFEVLPFDNYIEALTVQLAGGNPPDLGWIFERNAPEFIDAGVLTDLEPALAEAEDYGYVDLTESATELWREDDGLYAYPFSTSPFSMFYNADMFEEAGLENPTELYEAGEWTWEAVRESGAQIVAEGAAPHGFIVRDFDFQLWDNLATLWRGFGAEEWSEDGTQCGMAAPEMVDAFTFFHEAVFEDEAHPGPGQSADFFVGDSAMTVTQISRAADLEDEQFNWGVVPLPEGPAGDHQVVGQGAIGVFNASPNTEAAAEFLAHMTNEENSRLLAEFFPPPRESLLTAEVLGETNPLLSEEQLERVVVDGIATGTSIPTHVNFSVLQDTIRAELDAMWTADADVEAVLQQVCDVAEPLM